MTYVLSYDRQLKIGMQMIIFSKSKEIYNMYESFYHEVMWRHTAEGKPVALFFLSKHLSVRRTFYVI